MILVVEGISWNDVSPGLGDTQIQLLSSPSGVLNGKIDLIILSTQEVLRATGRTLASWEDIDSAAKRMRDWAAANQEDEEELGSLGFALQRAMSEHDLNSKHMAYVANNIHILMKTTLL